MNVKELIEVLSQYPEDTMVVVRGYEGGYDESKYTTEILLRLNANNAWYYGDHEEADKYTENPVKAVVIS
jgi:hypothetical protein